MLNEIFFIGYLKTVFHEANDMVDELAKGDKSINAMSENIMNVQILFM